MALYCIQDPKGKLLEGTVAESKGGAWSAGYERFAFPGWVNNGWLSYVNGLKRDGYQCVRVWLVTEEMKERMGDWR